MNRSPNLPWRVLATTLCLLASRGAAQEILFVDDDATPGGDGLSWETAWVDPQDALAEARAPGSTVTAIHVAQGVYRPDAGLNRNASFVLVDGVSLIGGFAGIGMPDPSERNVALHETILSGDLAGDDGADFADNEDNSFHVIVGTGVSAGAVVDGFTVTSGNATGNFPDLVGAGMLLNGGGSPTLRDCTFLANSAAAAGALYNLGGNPTLIRCRFVRNRATTLNGGAVYNSDNSNGTFLNCLFVDNMAFTFGGALSIFNAEATIRSCVLLRNSAGDGAGVAIQGSSEVTLEASTVAGNTAGNLGGGIRVLAGGLTVSSCILWANIDAGATTEGAQITGAASVDYSCVEGLLNLGGIGNIGDDPLLLDLNQDDVHIPVDSPSVDRGDPLFTPVAEETDLDGEPRVASGRVDMGADEFNDCNENGVTDSIDIQAGTSADCNANETPDECDIAQGTSADCNTNSVPDDCDLADGTSDDCNGDAIPDECQDTTTDCNENGAWDECDITGGTSADCNGNAIPDDCEIADGSALDCNGNGAPDTCDIVSGTSEDCDGNTVPDECEDTTVDCNGNSVWDACDVDGVVSEDCNGDSIPDECEIDAASTAPGGPFFCVTECDPDCNDNGIPDVCDIQVPSDDCDGNLVPDECELADNDCDGNLILDECDLTSGDGFDCNGNTLLDECDLAAGDSEDCNGNDLPDECEIDEASTAPGGPFHCTQDCRTDCDDSGVMDECELTDGTLADFNDNGIPDVCEADCDGDGVPDFAEIAWGLDTDCNENAIPDGCEGGDVDCNTNGVTDICDIGEGTSSDCDVDGVPDECQGDGDDDGTIDACDGCPTDPEKIAPGVCGCGAVDSGDEDLDGVLDCVDACPGTQTDANVDVQGCVTAGACCLQSHDVCGDMVEPEVCAALIEGWTFQGKGSTCDDGCVYDFSADADSDGDVDLQDVAGLLACFTGEGHGPFRAGCLPFDVNGDYDIDFIDLLAVVGDDGLLITGPKAP